MQISAAILSARSTIPFASSSVFSTSARAAAWANCPPEPIAATSYSGSMTSPLPEMTKIFSGSPTRSSASRRRRYRSERQSLASSIAARVRLPYFSSLPSKRSKSVNASAVPPAKPASTLSLYRRRTLRALPFMTVLPRVTCPSPPMAMAPLRRTASIVVPCGSNRALSVIRQSGFSACSRVSTVVNAGQVLKVKVGIDLGGREVGVAQELLHTAKFATGFKQMRREGVPEKVWIHRHAEPQAPRPRGDAQLHGAAAEPAAVLANEHRRLRGLGTGSSQRQPAPERLCRLGPDRDDTRLAPLAEHVHGAVFEVKVRKVKPDELGEAQPRRVEELHQRVIAHEQRLLGPSFQELAHLIGVECVRQAAR